ncbi:MAG: glycosyltransferase family 2 protein [Desulfovibrio sp.]|nr:glycosyltransferase family 2 protein [Desulfovibrio sp.]
MQPYISVIIPVFNSGNFLKQCLDSVCSQELENIEIICIDDGSSDFLTLKILDEFSFKDERITVYHQKNSGPGSARNKGIKHANGTYISFVDSDDYISPNFLKILYACAKKNSALIVTSKRTILFSNQNDRVEKIFIKELTPGQLNEEQSLGQILETGSCCNKIYKKDFLINNSIEFLENVRCSSEDNFFTIMASICAKNSFYLVDEPMYYYRQHSSSITKNINRQSCLDTIEVYRKILYKIRKGSFLNKKFLLNFVRKRFRIDFYRTYAIANINGRQDSKILSVIQNNIDLFYEIDILLIDKYFKYNINELIFKISNDTRSTIKISITILSDRDQYANTYRINIHNCSIKYIYADTTPSPTVSDFKNILPLLRRIFNYSDRCLYLTDISYSLSDMLNFYQTYLDTNSPYVQYCSDGFEQMILLNLYCNHTAASSSKLSR